MGCKSCSGNGIFSFKICKIFLLTMLLFTGSSSRAWSQPGHHSVSSLSAQNHDLDLQQTRLHGLVPQRRPLLHRVLALLLCPLHGGQPPNVKHICPSCKLVVGRYQEGCWTIGKKSQRTKK